MKSILLTPESVEKITTLLRKRVTHEYGDAADRDERLELFLNWRDAVDHADRIDRQLEELGRKIHVVVDTHILKRKEATCAKEKAVFDEEKFFAEAPKEEAQVASTTSSLEVAEDVRDDAADLRDPGSDGAILNTIEPHTGFEVTCYEKSEAPPKQPFEISRDLQLEYCNFAARAMPQLWGGTCMRHLKEVEKTDRLKIRGELDRRLRNVVAGAREHLDNDRDQAALEYISREVGGAFTVDLATIGGDAL